MMHKLLLPDAEMVDHIDRNSLDNRRKNLRPITRSRNVANNNAKGYYRTRVGTWQACIKKDKKAYTATFQTPEEAEAWRFKMKKALYGEGSDDSSD